MQRSKVGARLALALLTTSVAYAAHTLPAAAQVAASGSGYVVEGVRTGEHEGAPARFVDVTVRNTSPHSTTADGVIDVWWQGRDRGEDVMARRRNLAHFGMYDFVKPGQSLAVTYVIPAREDVDGITITDSFAAGSSKKRTWTWAELTPAASAAPSRSTAAAPKAASARATDSRSLKVPPEAAVFQTYGPWEFKVDELVRGPDGHIQAVVTARNASSKRLPFTITDFDAYLSDENGRTVQRLGNLYRVSPSGSVPALVIAGLSYLEPADEVRGRLLFHPTKGFDPVLLRLAEPVKSRTENSYAIPRPGEVSARSGAQNAGAVTVAAARDSTLAAARGASGPAQSRPESTEPAAKALEVLAPKLKDAVKRRLPGLEVLK